MLVAKPVMFLRHLRASPPVWMEPHSTAIDRCPRLRWAQIWRWETPKASTGGRGDGKNDRAECGKEGRKPWRAAEQQVRLQHGAGQEWQSANATAPYPKTERADPGTTRALAHVQRAVGAHQFERGQTAALKPPNGRLQCVAKPTSVDQQKQHQPRFRGSGSSKAQSNTDPCEKSPRQACTRLRWNPFFFGPSAATWCSEQGTDQQTTATHYYRLPVTRSLPRQPPSSSRQPWSRGARTVC